MDRPSILTLAGRSIRHSVSMFVARCVERVVNSRPADFIIGGIENPYMHRWWLVPRNPIFNVYLHYFMRSDDDRALHDHPWWNLSILLNGEYAEHTIKAGGIHSRVRRVAGDMKLRGASAAHRIELTNGPCWTLFLTGPTIRNWGFHLPTGWVPHEQFIMDDENGSSVYLDNKRYNSMARKSENTVVADMNHVNFNAVCEARSALNRLKLRENNINKDADNAKKVIDQIEAEIKNNYIAAILEGKPGEQPTPDIIDQLRKARAIVETWPKANAAARKDVNEAEHRLYHFNKLLIAEQRTWIAEQQEECAAALIKSMKLAMTAHLARMLAIEKLRKSVVGTNKFTDSDPKPTWSGGAAVRRMLSGIPERLKPREFNDSQLEKLAVSDFLKLEQELKDQVG